MASSLEDKLGEIYVQISADVKGLEKDIRDLKARMEKDSGKPKIDFVSVLAKKKISELEVMQKKLKAKLEEKIKMNVDLGSLNRTREMLNAVTRELEGVKGETAKASGGFMDMMKSGMKMAAGWFGITAALDMGRRIIQTASEFEQLRTRLVSLYGDTKKAGQVFEYLKDVASTTPYSLKAIVEAGAQLKAFGMDTEAMIKPVADLAAYMGMDVVEAANAMGRAFSGGAGAADILRERGVLNLVKDFKKIDDLTALTLPEFRKALQETLVDPAAGIVGSTDRMSKTFSGAMSNMMDSLESLAAVIGSYVLPLINLFIAGISSLTGALSGNNSEVEKATTAGQELKFRFDQLTNTYEKLRDKTNKTEGEHKILNETIAELMKTFPNYLKGVDLVKDSMDKVKESFKDARKELDEYVNSLIKAAAVKGMEKSITAMAEDQIRLERIKIGLKQSQEAINKGQQDPYEQFRETYKNMDAASQSAFMSSNPYFSYRASREMENNYNHLFDKGLPSIDEMIADIDAKLSSQKNDYNILKNEATKLQEEIANSLVTTPNNNGGGTKDDALNTINKLDAKIQELEKKRRDLPENSAEFKVTTEEIVNLTLRYEKLSKIYHFKDSSTSRVAGLKQELELVEELGKGLAEWHRVSAELIRVETDEMIKSGVKKEDALALQKKKMEELEQRYKKLAEAAARMVPIRVTEAALVRMDNEALAKLEGRIGDLRSRLQDIESGSKSSAGEVAGLKRELAELLSILDRERQKGNMPKRTLGALPFPNEKTYQENNFRDPTQMELWEEWMNQSQAAGEAFDTFVDVAMRGLDELRIRAAEDASAMEKMFVDMGNIIIQKIQEIIAAWAVMNLFSWISGGPGVGLLGVLGIGGGNSSGAVGGVQGFANGGSFTVPSGFTHDNYPIMVQSGERVNVTAANKVTDQERMIQTLGTKLDIIALNIIENGVQQMRQPSTQSVQVYGKFDGHQLYLATKKAERFNRRYR